MQSKQATHRLLHEGLHDIVCISRVAHCIGSPQQHLQRAHNCRLHMMSPDADIHAADAKAAFSDAEFKQAWWFADSWIMVPCGRQSHLEGDVWHGFPHLFQPPPGALVQEAQADCRQASRRVDASATTSFAADCAWRVCMGDTATQLLTSDAAALPCPPSKVAPPQHSRDAAPASA